MKYSLLFILIFFSTKNFAQIVSPILIEQGIVNENCNKVGQIDLEGNCYIGISKIIARSYNAEGLNNWMIADNCWGYIPNENFPEINTVDETRGVPINCTPPYDRCWNNYCPEKYAQIIASMVKMKATIILRATNTWDKNEHLRPGTPFYRTMQQMVVDINAAYDCAGLKRPIIQSSFFEWADFKSQSLIIPLEILNEFKDDPEFERDYYFNTDGSSKNRPFVTERVINGKDPFPNSPNINKIEARMWMYYSCKTYIDLGFTSIHMGQMLNWAYYDQQDGYRRTVEMIRKIRNYAKSKNQICLLSEENYKAFKIPGTDSFLYDFDSRALRPREISNPRVCGDWDCDTRLDNYLVNSPCEKEQFPAILDKCVVEHYGNSSGIAPLGNCRYDLMPFTTYFDLGVGIHEPEGVASSGCTGPDGTWGYDDSKWLAEKISSECRKFFLENAVCRIRDFYNGNGFFTLPGLMFVLKPEQYGNAEKGINPTASGQYLLSDEMQIHESIESLWQARTVEKIHVVPYYRNFWGEMKLLENKNRRNVYYRLYPESTECTSIYSWTIKKDGETFEQDKIGKELYFQKPFSGTFQAILRQDNFGGIGEENLETILYEIDF